MRVYKGKDKHIYGTKIYVPVILDETIIERAICWMDNLQKNINKKTVIEWIKLRLRDRGTDWFYYLDRDDERPTEKHIALSRKLFPEFYP